MITERSQCQTGQHEPPTLPLKRSRPHHRQQPPEQPKGTLAKMSHNATSKGGRLCPAPLRRGNMRHHGKGCGNPGSIMQGAGAAAPVASVASKGWDSPVAVHGGAPCPLPAVAMASGVGGIVWAAATWED